MIEVKIPTNTISDYKPKFLLGLTGRQFICAAIAIVLIALDLIFLKPYIGDFAIVLAALPAAVAAGFGWITPCGMSFEKYLQSVLLVSLVAPKCRKAKMKGSFVVPCDKYYEPIPDSAVSPEVMEHVNYVREKIGIPKENAMVGLKGRSDGKTGTRPKYKKSKSAYL